MNDTSMDKLCNISDSSRLHSLAEDATVSCRLCGAKSHEPENVCDPVQLPEPHYFGD